VHSLVQEVGAQVVNGGATGNNLVLPLVFSCGLFRTVAVEVSLELGDAAEGAVLDELGESNKISVPATICRVNLSENLLVGNRDGVE
jgi:hypothetical protein